MLNLKSKRRNQNAEKVLSVIEASLSTTSSTSSIPSPIRHGYYRLFLRLAADHVAEMSRCGHSNTGSFTAWNPELAEVFGSARKGGAV